MTTHIGMLLYPGLTQLDLTGPFEVFARMPDAAVHLVSKDAGPVRSDMGLTITPTTTLEACPALDVLFVPGGGGQVAVMEDDAWLDFVAAQGQRARWVTSACTGALVLGAAGLLSGYRAATHWAFMPLLSMFGATPVSERVVIDRNRITAGGVTAGIDFALRVVAEVSGEAVAKKLELYLEYDPHPPFKCGHPRVAPSELTESVQREVAERFRVREEQIARIVARVSR
ncbi:MAG: DJ-1/PfpI family protein [Myxococcales bacterium]|nr:DJ-1/PfpI family protein [Myxococcales bacterium]